MEREGFPIGLVAWGTLIALMCLKSLVKFLVVRVREYQQILDPIIKLVTIYMMYLLFSIELASEVFFHYKSVFVLFRFSMSAVAIICYPPAFVFWVILTRVILPLAFMTTKLVGILDHLTLKTVKGRTALDTDKLPPVFKPFVLAFDTTVRTTFKPSHRSINKFATRATWNCLSVAVGLTSKFVSAFARTGFALTKLDIRRHNPMLCSAIVAVFQESSTFSHTLYYTGVIGGIQ